MVLGQQNFHLGAAEEVCGGLDVSWPIGGNKKLPQHGAGVGVRFGRRQEGAHCFCATERRAPLTLDWTRTALPLRISDAMNVVASTAT